MGCNSSKAATTVASVPTQKATQLKTVKVSNGKSETAATLPKPDASQQHKGIRN